MRSTTAALLAMVTVLVLLVLVAYAWYHLLGWRAFSYATGDSPAWAPAKSGDIAYLRFKDCVFTVSRGDGVTKAYDVTPVLNGMAVAYRGGTANPLALTLVRPLNPFSFIIPGFNDRKTVPDPTVAPWCTSPPPACTADGQCPVGVPGACSWEAPHAPPGHNPGPVSPLGTCFSCPGGAAVTLAGKWRMI